MIRVMLEGLAFIAFLMVVTLMLCAIPTPY